MSSSARLEDLPPEQWRRLTERLRAHCAQVAARAGLDASMAGLCAEGALEAASSALEMLDPDTVRRVALAEPIEGSNIKPIE